MLRVVTSAVPHLWRQSGAVRLSTTGAHLLRDGDTATVKKVIKREDVAEYGELVEDNNPVHEDIVHGTFLLGLVSGVMASRLPGPGTVLTSLSVKFIRPCRHPATVQVVVEVGRVRKITKTQFRVEDSDTQEVLVRGEASCYLSPDQLQ